MIKSINNLNSEKKNFLIFLIIVIGIILRLMSPKLGHHTTDIEWWLFINDIYSLNGDFYGTGVNVYAPGFISILWFLDNLPFFDLDNLNAFRFKLIIFLTITDVLIFILLLKRFSLLIGVLFFFNPISIFITGFHNQFDNIAILIGLFSVIIFEKRNKYSFYFSMLLLGLSLIIKHILFIFPIWLAIKEKIITRKLLIILIPYSLFVISFTPFLPHQFDSIISDVFLYQSFSNGPFWSIFTPQFLGSYIGYKNLFIIALILLGFYLDKKSIMDTFLIYLIAVVTFSSAVANQYLAIPLVAIAVYWNPYFLFYTLCCTFFFTINHDALDIDSIKEIINYSRKKARIGYKIIIFFLSLGLLQTLIGEKKLNIYFKRIFFWFKSKIKDQISIK